MNQGHHSRLSEIQDVLEARHREIDTRIIELANLRVIDNYHFIADGVELYVDPMDDLPLKQLCSLIGMSYGFYRKNPGALNQQIFDTHLRELRSDNTDAEKEDKGARIFRFRRQPDGKNRLLAILPTNHVVMPYVSIIDPLMSALPGDARVRLSNHETVDHDHRLTLRVSFPQFHLEAVQNDPLEMGMFLDLSEDLGTGRDRMTGMLYRLVCENGAMTTFNDHPYFEFNHRGIRPVDLGAAFSSAVSRFGNDLEFVHQRALESTRAIMTKEEVEAFLRDLENHRNVSAGFLRKVRQEITTRSMSEISRWDVVGQITQQCQSLPHHGRIQHEFLAGRLLGLNLHTDESAEG